MGNEIFFCRRHLVHGLSRQKSKFRKKWSLLPALVAFVSKGCTNNKPNLRVGTHISRSQAGVLYNHGQVQVKPQYVQNQYQLRL